MFERERVLKNGDRKRLVLHGCLNAEVQVTEDLELRPLPIGSVDDIPWSLRTVGILQILVVNSEVLVIMFVFLKVCVAHTPARILVSQKPLETLLLLLAADVEEELHYQISVVGQLALSHVDAADPLFILFVVQTSFDPVPRDLIHPEGIVELKFAGLRDLDEIAIEERFAEFIGRGRLVHRRDLEETRVDVLYDVRDRTALAGRAPAFKDDHNGKFGFFDLHAIGRKLALFGADTFPDIFFRRLFWSYIIIEH